VDIRIVNVFFDKVDQFRYLENEPEEAKIPFRRTLTAN